MVTSRRSVSKSVKKARRSLGSEVMPIHPAHCERLAPCFFTVEEIIDNLSKLTLKSSAVAKAKSVATKANSQNNAAAIESKTILKKLKQAYQNTPQNDGRVHKGQLKETLNKLDNR